MNSNFKNNAFIQVIEFYLTCRKEIFEMNTYCSFFIIVTIVSSN